MSSRVDGGNPTANTGHAALCEDLVSVAGAGFTLPRQLHHSTPATWVHPTLGSAGEVAPLAEVSAGGPWHPLCRAAGGDRPLFTGDTRLFAGSTAAQSLTELGVRGPAQHRISSAELLSLPAVAVEST